MPPLWFEFRKGLARGAGIVVAVLLGAGITALVAQSLHVFSQGQVVSASQLNANFQKIAPIGSILAWHKSLTGTPALPDGWVECDGSTINDASSPMNGQATPNLNSPPNAWNSRGVFLRGHSSSGIFENDQFQGHRHTSRIYGGNPNAPLTPGASTELGQNGPTTDPIAGVNGGVRSGDETRSVNMAVVWIMRIK